MEVTYVRSRDHCEVMVNDDVKLVYGFFDSCPSIPGVRWVTGDNPLFKHARPSARAIAYVKKHFNEMRG